MSAGWLLPRSATTASATAARTAGCSAPAPHPHRACPGALPGIVRFGVVSCAIWQGGYFAAYRGLAERDDLQPGHLGDYFYEYGPEEDTATTRLSGEPVLRPQNPPHEMVSLADYRRRHSRYKTDPDLQAAHARHPWIVTNNSWRHGAGDHDPETEGDWHRRRSRAYDEWMPVRKSPLGLTGLPDAVIRPLDELLARVPEDGSTPTPTSGTTPPPTATRSSAPSGRAGLRRRLHHRRDPRHLGRGGPLRRLPLSGRRCDGRC